MVEQWNNDGGTEEHRWWNSGTDMVEERMVIVMVEQRNSYGGKVDRDGGTEMVEQWNSDGGKEEQLW